MKKVYNGEVCKTALCILNLGYTLLEFSASTLSFNRQLNHSIKYESVFRLPPEGARTRSPFLRKATSPRQFQVRYYRWTHPSKESVGTSSLDTMIKTHQCIVHLSTQQTKKTLPIIKVTHGYNYQRTAHNIANFDICLTCTNIILLTMCLPLTRSWSKAYHDPQLMGCLINFHANFRIFDRRSHNWVSRFRWDLLSIQTSLKTVAITTDHWASNYSQYLCSWRPINIVTIRMS